MEGRFPFASKNFMKYCLDIKSDFKFGLDLKNTKFIVKKAYNKKMPDFILNKNKTGWSAPIMSWLKIDKSLKEKFDSDIAKDDGIKNALLDYNYIDDIKIGESLSGKRKIITWMLRSAQEFDMHL